MFNQTFSDKLSLFNSQMFHKLLSTIYVGEKRDVELRKTLETDSRYKGKFVMHDL